MARLLADGVEVRAVDCKPTHLWWQRHPDADNRVFDVSHPDDAAKVVRGAEAVYNLACRMGGIGFIERFRAECASSVLITATVLDQAMRADVERFFYASSACVYRQDRQRVTGAAALAEDDAWPADPEPGYGLEKLYGEELCRYYAEDYGMRCRVARYHNVYGPMGSWTGGKEKAPAALCRKVAEAKLGGIGHIDVWGDGRQERSFMFVDDCVEGTLRVMDGDYAHPLNVGSNRMVTVDGLLDIIEGVAGTDLERRYDTSAPQGVRGRNSDNTLIRHVLGWSPSITLEDGLACLYPWVESQVIGASTQAG